MRVGNPWRVVGWGIAVALILTPLVAMQFTKEVNWTVGDFVFAAVMIGGVGLLFEFAVRASRSWAYRGGVAVGLATTFLLIWINGAVGIVGNEDNPVNLVFGVIILMALAGTIVARAKAKGMVRAMTVAGCAQALVGVAVFARGIAAHEPPGAFGLLILIEFFAGLWFISAMLFGKAAREV
jgi:hypothetical protein